MARPVDRDAKRLQILEAAAARFAQSGYEATSMDDLAAAAGVSKGSLYDYFENKEDLFYGAFEWLQDVLLRVSMERMREETGAQARLVAFADASVGAFMDHVAFYPVMLDVWSAAAKTGTRGRFATAMQSLYTDYRSQVTALIIAGQESGEIKQDMNAAAVGAMLIGAIDGLLLQYWLDPNFDPRHWVRSFFAALFDGMAVEKKGNPSCA